MHLTRLALTNFRNYARLEVSLSARIHLLEGENAQGKTNLLEAIYYLATTRSPLASSDRELIAWGARGEVIPYARLSATYLRGGEEHTTEMSLVLERQPGEPLEGATFRRQIWLDGVPRRAMDVVGRLLVVLFLPEDIALVAGAPGERRRYLDITLCQTDSAYCRALARYNRVLAQRNALLRAIRERQAQRNELTYWDEELSKLGALILARRMEGLRALEQDVQPVHHALTGGQERLSLHYMSTVPCPGAPGAPTPPEEARLIEAFRVALEAARSEEIGRGVTTIGPHRDDVRLLADGVDMTIYGSRGQQRTVALALKLGEMAFMRRAAGEFPVLLLDDVASELDEQRRRFLLGAIREAPQVLITTTSLRDYPADFCASAVRWRVVKGTLLLDERPTAKGV